MAKVILICGKICSGKTTCAGQLRKKENAVVLSSDELMLSLFDPLLGDKHDEISGKVNEYLLNLSLKLIEAGTNVILDWGFWTRAGRKQISDFYAQRGVRYQWYYLKVTDEQWMRNIEKRNREVRAGKTQAYFVDEGLLNKLKSRFEEPEDREMPLLFYS